MDNISGNIVPLIHLDGNLNSSGDQQTVYRGYSAYEIALQQGFEGSKDEWLRALVGPQGETGVSISDVRLNDDFTLTVTLDDGTEFTTESIKGDKGEKGDKGAKGDKGDKGDTGDTGAQGIQGAKGDTGADGISPTVTITPITGGHRITITDADGTETADVMDGDDYILTASVSKSGKVATITITDKNGTTSAQVSDGEDGATGATPNLTIGTVETLEPSESATASITGTPENPVLNLGIPQGEQGEVTLEDYYKAFPTDTASGAIASFSDGADDLPLKSLVVNIDPVQDLHGQESPYPAGGGKNLIIPPEYTATTPTLCLDLGADTEFSAITLQFKATDAVTLYNNAAIIDFQKDDETHQYVTLADFYNENGVKFTPNTVLNGTFSSTKTNVTFRQAYIYYEYNSFAKFQSDCLTEWQLAVGSTPTDYAPYENICPISGWTQVGVEQSGKNLLRLPVVPYNTVNPYGTATTFDPADYMWMKAGTYTLSYTCSVANRSYIKLADRNGNMLSDNAHKPNVTFYYNANYSGWIRGSDQAAGDATATITLIEDCYVRICRSFTNPDTIEFTNSQLELGSTATEYEPYTGRSITIDLGQTVYGGKLDVLTGELTIDRAMVDLGTLSWWKTLTDTANVHRYTSGGITTSVKAPSANNVKAKIVCSSYETHTADKVYLKNIGIGIIRSGDISIYDPRFDKPENTAAEFKEAMNGVMLCYELAEPIEIQLSANQINSLYGVNNIWADTGDTEVEYRADTKLFIERLTAPDSADMIADANIVSGQYFMVGNSLYKATANIANGSTIVVGTNCTRKSLSEALNEINA